MDYWLFSPVADKVGEGIIGAVTLGEGMWRATQSKIKLGA